MQTVVAEITLCFPDHRLPFPDLAGFTLPHSRFSVSDLFLWNGFGLREKRVRKLLLPGPPRIWTTPLLPLAPATPLHTTSSVPARYWSIIPARFRIFPDY